MISTHILDTSLGNPAQGVAVELDRKSGEGWIPIARAETNADGRIAFNCPAEPGTYRLQFRIEPYFRRHGLMPFFTEAPVIFHVTDTGRKYHVPLLLNPYGYSTYRGS
jgi:hydroxyisourate hydrolase